MAVLALLAFATPASADTFTVSNESDSDPGSLRAAMLLANAAPGDDIINFTADVHDIGLLSQLPTIAANGRLNIAGPGAANLRLTRTGVAKYRLFEVGPGADAMIQALEVIDGDADAGAGGAVLNNGSLTLRGVGLRSNEAAQGGAIHTTGPGLAVLNSLIRDNTVTGAGSAGGISASGTPVFVNNSTVTGNSATVDGSAGGVIAVGAGSRVSLSNSTLAANSAFPGGTTGATDAEARSGGTIFLFSSILADSLTSRAHCAGGTSVISFGYNLEEGNSCSLIEKGDRINADPALGALTTSTGGATAVFPLPRTSPAVDKGKALAGLTVDQRGSRRPADLPDVPNATDGDGSDVGAYEYLVTTATVTTLADSGAGSLRQALINANSGGAGDTNIVFAAGLTGTIALAGPLPVLTRQIVIDGPGASKLTIRRNSGGSYPVIRVAPGTTAVVQDVSLVNGRVDLPDTAGGGAIQAPGANLTVRNAAILSNSSAVGPGGIAGGGGGRLRIENSAIAGNVGPVGGVAAGTTANQTVISNSTISGNTGTGGAGGLSLAGGATVQSSTVANNAGGAAAAANIASSGSPATKVRSTIVANPNGTRPNCTGALVSSGFNLDSGTSCGLSSTTDIRNRDPKLQSFANNGGEIPTRGLGSLSPAIDKGGAVSGVSSDARGTSRPQIMAGITKASGGDGSDIGSFEFSDNDKDGYLRAEDNCPTRSNPTQADLDKDKLGDSCDTDIDGDKVLNTADSCDRLKGPRATGCPASKRSLTLKYSVARKAFSGKLKSTTIKRCRSKRSVIIYLRLAGPDRRIATVKTLNSGAFLKRSGNLKPGLYYARAARQTVTDLALCGQATAKNVRVKATRTR